MTVTQRLYLLVFSAVVGLISLAVLCLFQMEKVYTSANYANINTVPSLLALDEAFKELALIRAQVWQQMALNDDVKKAEVVQKINEEYGLIIEQFNLYEKEDIADDKDRVLLAVDRSTLEAYDTLRAKVLALSDEGKVEEARAAAIEPNCCEEGGRCF